MNDTEALAAIVDAIALVAPDADPTDVAGDADFMEELDLDSIDLVTIVTLIHDHAGVEIPESDYGELFSLDGFTAYLMARSEVGS